MSSQQQVDVELQQILVQVSHLQRWRLQTLDDGARLLDQAKQEEPEEAPPPCRTLPQLVSIPRQLIVSPALGGTPITPDLAQGLRNLLFGKSFHIFNYEWRKSVFQFRERNSELSYALEMDRGGAQVVQMVIQARIIKHLLFVRQSSSDTLNSLCQIGQRDQEVALAAALCDSLWLAGQELSATVTLVTEDYCITPQMDYKQDNFTEKLQLFTFSDRQEVMSFILEHLQCFTAEGSHGVILFLYSLLCSCTVHRLKDDLDSSHLLHLSLGNFVCQQSLINLLLTGRACPHVFNGTLLSLEGRPLERPLQGVSTRSDVGFLQWSREQSKRGTLPQVGSMLKTPRFPVWLCSVNSSSSVLFALKRSLLSDWRVEHLFHLHFYSGHRSQTRTATLTVDTHSHHWEAAAADLDGDPERRTPSLEMTIRTKWAGAAVDWNGNTPFY